MVLSCRHCYAPDEEPFSRSTSTSTNTSTNKHPAPYSGFFVYGDHQSLRRMMEWVEDGQQQQCKPITSITVWCEQCRSISIISYKFYRHLCMEEDHMPESDILGMHEYYSRMCMSAERLITFFNQGGN